MPRNGAFPSYCQKIPKQCLKLGPSPVTVRKFLHNASNWGLPHLLSENAKTVPQIWAFPSYCQKMPQQCLELGPSSVTVIKCLNNASYWDLSQLL